MGAVGFHHLVEQRDVERDDGDGGAGLGDEGLVDGNPGLAVERGQLFIEDFLNALQVFLGLADRAVFVNRPGDRGSDIGVGNGADAIGEDTGFQQGVDPQFPIRATHDSHGLVNIVALGGLDGDFIDHSAGGVEVFVGVAPADGFKDGFIDFAGFRIGAAG